MNGQLLLTNYQLWRRSVDLEIDHWDLLTGGVIELCREVHCVFVLTWKQGILRAVIDLFNMKGFTILMPVCFVMIVLVLKKRDAGGFGSGYHLELQYLAHHHHNGMVNVYKDH